MSGHKGLDKWFKQDWVDIGSKKKRVKKTMGGAMKKRVMKRGGGMMKKPMMKRGGKVK